MIGLSNEIESALNTTIDGLNYDLFKSQMEAEGVDDMEVEVYVQSLDPDKMKGIMESKTSSFKSAKTILDKWMNSPNAPHQEKVADFIQRLVDAGETAIGTLREALSWEINFDKLEAHKHNAAIKAKPIILSSIFELNSALIELREKLETGDLSLSEREFKLGYPEKFARGDFFPAKDYHKNWHDEDKDIIRICPHSTKGKVITIDELKIQLPKPPPKKDILFSTYRKKDQYWRRVKPPEGITPESVDLWDEYITEEFRRRREGIWFMNNGVPTYLTGNAYFALQWCVMFDNGDFMNFREAQLRMFYHLEACIVDKRCLGQAFLKSRRTGFTYIILFIMLNSGTSLKNGKYGMTSKSGDDVEEAFEKFSYAFRNLPFFFRPVVRGKEDSLVELYFGEPSDNTKEKKKSRKSNIKDYLNTSFDHRPTKDDSYDSVKLDMYMGDEAFKWKRPHDYIVHMGMVTPTMMPSGKVVGKAWIGSTMGARKKGGAQGIEILSGSMIKDRDPVTGKTSTGLYFSFLPAQENMEAFTDKYGKCWTTKPPKGTLNSKGDEITMGSLDYLIAIEKQKEKQSDKALNEQYRTYPRTVEHALRDEAAESVFNLTKLYEQLEYNESFEKKQEDYTVGDFDWVDGVKDGDVMFNPNKNGRFKVSWMPSAVDGTKHLQNRVKKQGNKYFPLNLNLVRFGCDPYSYKSTHGKGSKGSIHGKTVNLPSDGAPQNMFVLEYIARPSDETIFFEDVIKMVKFYGSPILVESNRLDLLRHMYNRGYRGFAMDRLDRPKHKLNPNEVKFGGQMMSGVDILDSHMGAIGTWIQNYVGIYKDEVNNLRPIGEMGDMVFNETLRDWLAFDPDKRTEYDATISSGLAIMACQSDKYKGVTEERPKKVFKGLVKKYSNKGSIGSAINY